MNDLYGQQNSALASLFNHSMQQQSEFHGGYSNQVSCVASTATSSDMDAYIKNLAASIPSKTPTTKKGKSMFSEVATDVKSLILEHRSILYFIAIALILDHLLFKDAFRHRLQSMADKMVAKVEAKI